MKSSMWKTGTASPSRFATSAAKVLFPTAHVPVITTSLTTTVSTARHWSSDLNVLYKMEGGGGNGSLSHGGA